MLKPFFLCGVVIVGAVFIFSGCTGETGNSVEKTVETVTGLGAVSQGEAAKKDLAVAQCQTLFQQKFAVGENLANGPCLSETIIADWSCDVAHSPRTAVDDQPANQCAAYRSGETHHFVELDINGQLIKAQ